MAGEGHLSGPLQLLTQPPLWAAGMGKWREDSKGDIPCVANTHHSQSPSVQSRWALLGELVGRGLSQPIPTTTPKSVITFRKQLGTGARSPLLISPLKRCHSRCQDHAHP